MIKKIHIVDDLSFASQRATEVEIELEDGTIRWCFFHTPESIKNCGDCIDGTTARVHYGVKHMFVVSEISEEIIESTIHMLVERNELLACTL